MKKQYILGISFTILLLLVSTFTFDQLQKQHETNMRIIDACFEQEGVSVNVKLEGNAFSSKATCH